MTVVRDRNEAKKTNIGVKLSNGSQARIGKAMKKRIVRKIREGADPKEFGLHIETLARWMPERNFLVPHIPTAPKPIVPIDFKGLKGRDRADEVRRQNKAHPELALKDLADMFGCGKSTIGDIVNYRTFA